MTFTPLCDGIYIAAQLNPQDIPLLCTAGIRSVICHRPDGEEAHQPEFANLAAVIRAAGIAHTYHQPVVGALINEDDALVLDHILHETEWPVLMFCYSGTRCAYLWSLLQAMRGVSVDDLIANAEQIGINLRAVRVKLENVEAIPSRGQS